MEKGYINRGKRFDTRGSESQESGIVLVMLALLIIPLIIFIALAIDTGRLSTSHSQLRYTTDLAALGALEAFIVAEERAGTNLTFNELVEAARQRAQELATFSVLLANTEQTPVAENTPAREIEVNTMGPAGMIEPGSWWFEQPDGGCTAASASGCPCSASATWEGPCFQPVAGGLTATANAFRVTLRTKETSPLRNIFGPATGLLPNTPAHEEVPITVTSIASLIPRHAVFIVDLSGSTQEDTHISSQLIDPFATMTQAEQDDMFNDRPSEMRYRLRQTSATCGAAGMSQCQCTAGSRTNPCPNDNCSVWGLPHLLMYQNAANVRVGTSVYPSTAHSKDDYECFILNNERGTEHYLVDTERRNTTDRGMFQGAEPLNSILASINVAMDVLVERSVPGDSIAVVGFDQGAEISSRIIGPTNPQDTTTFNRLRRLTDVDNTSTVQERIEAAFFPLVPSDTDVPEALLTAAGLLEDQALSETADNFVVLFSDGLTNCRHTPAFQLSGGEVIPGTTEECERDAADNDERFAILQDSLRETSCILSGIDCPAGTPPELESFEREDITFHMIMVGDSVAPNTVLAQNASGNGCLTDTEVRAAGGAFAAGEIGTSATYANRSRNAPYLYPNNMFFTRGVQPTGGFWLPLRRPCNFPGITTAECRNDGDGVTYLNQLCTNGVGPGGIENTANMIASNSSGTNFHLVCDARCRSIRQQAEDFVRQIYAQSPFMLVEEP